MSNMRNDVKLRRIINKYGLEGYGLYNLIVESITESLTTQSPIPELQETCEDIASFYNSDTARINEIVSYMINQGLFELNEEGVVLCVKIYKFLEANQTRSAEIRQMIQEYKLASQTVSDSPRQIETVEDKSEEENRKEENRKEENRKEEKKSYADTVKMTVNEYEKLVQRFGVSQTKKMIDKLDAYKGSKGKKYKSDYKAILTWVVDAIGAKPNITGGWTCPRCGAVNTHSGDQCTKCKEFRE